MWRLAPAGLAWGLQLFGAEERTSAAQPPMLPRFLRLETLR